jgi:hypothetical protein
MKNLIIIGICCVLVYALLPSCEDMFGDYLDKAPGIDVTEDTIFSSQEQVEMFIAGIYKAGIHTGAPGLDNNWMSRMDGWESGITDEGESIADWFWTNWWNSADAPIPTWTMDFRFAMRWTCIRMCFTLLDRIDDVPGINSAFANRSKGEATWMIAMQYFEMFKFYGGVPIIPKKLSLTQDELLYPRNTVAEVVDYIIQLCDEAAQLLPDSYPADLTGHVTKGCALALKSRTLLYAASPTFNTANPYLDFGANNPLICYGNYDVNRWQIAADAAKAVLDWAPSGGVHLITDKGVDKNYEYVWQTYDNAEFILSEKLDNGSQSWWYWLVGVPQMYGGLGPITVPFNFVKLYRKADGTPQTWDPAGGSDLQAKYSELEPRFHQSIAYNHCYWNADFPDMHMYEGTPLFDGCKGGHWQRKHMLAAYSYGNTSVSCNWPIFRLAEFYLNYAEALNEAQGPTTEAYAAVNAIRSRSGLPNLPADLTQDQFRDEVRLERTIEFAFEEHRLWDIRRWEIAEQDGVMKGNMIGFHITPNADTTEFNYEPYVFETRRFPKRAYRHPFEQDEVFKGYLIQNPGY